MATTPIVIRSASQLARQFNLQNVRILQPSKSNFQLPTQTNIPDPQLYLSLLGTKVLVDLTFHGKTYTDELGNVVTFDDMVLETVLASVTVNKNIVKTQIQGRKGAVKEYIGLGDYDVSISGIIVGGNGIYPRTEVQQLISIIQCNEAITVTSWYLQMFGINSLVIDNGASINQDEGQYSRQPFTIPCISDEDENLRF
jgi:hypothetical protein